MKAINKIYITVIAFISAFVILLVFGIMPILRGLATASDKIISQKATLEVFQARLKNIDYFNKKKPSYKPSLDRLASCFVRQEAPVGFIEFLEKEADSLNLLIKISPARSSANKDIPSNWGKIWLAVSVNGSFSNCLKFIDRLEHSEYLLDISQVNIKKEIEKSGQNTQSQSESGNLGEISVDMLLTAFSNKNYPK